MIKSEARDGYDPRVEQALEKFGTGRSGVETGQTGNQPQNPAYNGN